MKKSVRRRRVIGRAFVRLVGIAQNPLCVIRLLLRDLDWRGDFRIGRLVLSARGADIGAISDVAIEDEYGFVRALDFPSTSALILDLGANVGCFSALVLSTWPDSEVHSIEPSPDTFAILSENRERYPRLRWHTHRLAIAASSGTVLFHNEGPSTSRKLSPSATTGVAVEAEEFDSFVKRVAGQRRVFICKMDIEGAEVPIFAGPMDSLSQIDHFIVEVHGPAENAKAAMDRLSAAFPHVEMVQGRRSSKPMIHAWRVAPPDGAPTL